MKSQNKQIVKQYIIPYQQLNLQVLYIMTVNAIMDEHLPPILTWKIKYIFASSGSNSYLNVQMKKKFMKS